MHDPFANPQPLEVWMDGSCPLCRRSQTWCELRDHDDRVVFRDFRSADDVELPVERAAHEEAMWVRTVEGTLHRGFAGWRLIMNEIPRWRWLSWIAGLPPLSWIGPHIYRLVAASRHRLN